MSGIGDFPSDDAGARMARRAAAGGIVGPVAFAATWLTAGIVKARYAPLHDPISELAAVHASTRIAMTAAFVVFAVGMGAYAWALRAVRAGPAWVTAALSGLATLGVAAFPLHHSATIDRVHGVCAGTGYVTLAATALLGAVAWRWAGAHRLSTVAAGAGLVCAASLALTLAGSYEGLFQRVGLTVGDVWVVTSAVSIRRAARSRVSRSRAR